MSQSLAKNYIHIVFSTKHREKLILPSIEDEIYHYLGGICIGLECPVLRVGGHLNHVHILCMLSKKITLIKLLEEIKSHSSGWVKKRFKNMDDFYWQGGYGAFSVSPWYVDTIIEYIENQHAHHTKEGFKDEFRRILIENRVEYDERFVWD